MALGCCASLCPCMCASVARCCCFDLHDLHVFCKHMRTGRVGVGRSSTAAAQRTRQEHVVRARLQRLQCLTSPSPSAAKPGHWRLVITINTTMGARWGGRAGRQWEWGTKATIFCARWTADKGRIVSAVRTYLARVLSLFRAHARYMHIHINTSCDAQIVIWLRITTGYLIKISPSLF